MFGIPLKLAFLNLKKIVTGCNALILCCSDVYKEQMGWPGGPEHTTVI